MLIFIVQLMGGEQQCDTSSITLYLCDPATTFAVPSKGVIDPYGSSCPFFFQCFWVSSDCNFIFFSEEKDFHYFLSQLYPCLLHKSLYSGLLLLIDYLNYTHVSGCYIILIYSSKCVLPSFHTPPTKDHVWVIQLSSICMLCQRLIKRVLPI